MVADQDNKVVLDKILDTCDPRGLAFDLQDNIFICTMNDTLRQIRRGGGESRNIALPGIIQSYNVVLHPTGEKVLIFDIHNRFCVYKVLWICLYGSPLQNSKLDNDIFDEIIQYGFHLDKYV